MTSKRTFVAISETKNARYPRRTPYNPPELYPEYPFGSTIDTENNIYSAVRDLLIKLALDQKNLGKSCWNPFGYFIKPGDKVVVKPNLVVDSHYLSEVDFQSAVTHGSVIRPIIDYTYLALKGIGKIIVADGPIDLTDFNDTTQKNGLFQTINYLKTEYSVPIELLDLREERLKKISSCDIGNFEMSIWIRELLSGDPLGYVTVDLKEDSEFEEIADKCQYIRSTQLIRNKYEPTYHHRQGKHEYSIAKTILDSDVVINVPKLKAHKKTGNTINLKNAIGTIVPRYWMPHFRQNYDEFDNTVRIKQKIIKYLWSLSHINGIGCILIRDRSNISKIEIGGSNPNNDTLWRAILDVNKILFYTDKNGNIQNTPQRKYFSIVDGIIGGEKNSPLAPSPKETKLIIGGFDPIAVDYISTEIMGFDFKKIKTITKALELRKYPLGITNANEITTIGGWSCVHFIPPSNWIGYIEKYKSGISLDNL